MTGMMIPRTSQWIEEDDGTIRLLHAHTNCPLGNCLACADEEQAAEAALTEEEIGA